MNDERSLERNTIYMQLDSNQNLTVGCPEMMTGLFDYCHTTAYSALFPGDSRFMLYLGSSIIENEDRYLFYLTRGLNQRAFGAPSSSINNWDSD